MQLLLVEAVERICCGSVERKTSSSFRSRQRTNLPLGHELANHGRKLLHLRVSRAKLANELYMPSPEVGDLSAQLGVLGALQGICVRGAAPCQHLLKCRVDNLP